MRDKAPVRLLVQSRRWRNPARLRSYEDHGSDRDFCSRAGESASRFGAFAAFRTGTFVAVFGRRSWSDLAPTILSARSIALADQAVVSGASFATMILLSRWTGPDQIGFYSIGTSILVTYLGIQDSLVSLPYTIQQSQSADPSAERAGGSLVHSVLWSSVGSAFLAIAALVALWMGSHAAIATMIGALAGAAPFALLREFCRRFAFAHLQMIRALTLDAATAAVQLFGLFWLGWSGKMTAAGAYMTIGVACALTSLSSLFFMRTRFIVRPVKTWDGANRSWRLGKWLLASQTIVSAQSYVTHWLLALSLGATATGVYAACASIVMVANPLVIGIGNTVAPRAARALTEGGPAKLRTEAIESAFLLSAATSLVCLILLLLGERILGFLFHGDVYAHRGSVIAMLGLTTVATAISLPAAISLASIGRPQLIVRFGSMGLALSAALVWLLAPRYGVLGAAFGSFIGNSVNSTGLWVAFVKSLERLDSAEKQTTDRTTDAEFVFPATNSRAVSSVGEKRTRPSSHDSHAES
jgi:O-antigen/teichoic acid export membrane protein